MLSLPDLRSADDLTAFLRDELDWPLPEDAVVEDLTFDWSEGDLRLGEKASQRLKGGVVRQLRPMTPGQPWGIFLVEFAETHVYRTALRQVLRGLVPSRRKQANLAAWQHENLLFICATKDYGRLTFAHFRGDQAGRARLATFGWERGARYARTLLEFNLPALRWPAAPGGAPAWLAAWGAAFDVEPVTREFFRVYRTVFEQVEAAVTGLPDPERRRLFTQRLFNRLMFIAFIEKKGWLKLGGRTDYLHALWHAWTLQPDETGQSFYDARLRLLFFQALNNAHEQNLMAINRGGLLGRLLGDVPYLNGGLFEHDADDRDARVTVPDAAFAAIFTGLFERFNFTVTESTPLDVEVAVDPEMLGKVFEELVTGRHESGSYYTPKPIVAFMCREALKHYLAGVLPEDSAALARFVDEHEPAALRDGEAVLGALRRVRVCDPACGSGAYLLGMLHELLELRTCLFASQKIDAVSAHQRKLEIIQHNLYGVDLDPFAVNIARLRLWLSLAVEYEGGTPPPLPNLDFKIEAGDSLAAPDPQTVFSGQGALRVTVAKQFQEAKAAYLLAHGSEKKALREKADAMRTDLKTWLHSEAPAGAFDWAVEFAEVFAPRPAVAALDGGLNLGDTLAATEPGGFDIIVANPPYVRMELIKPLKPMLRRNFATVHDERTDLYIYFYARAHELLRRGGVAAFISSNKWLRAGYGEKLRQLLLDAQAFHLVADFGELPVFQTAATFPAIFVWEKTPRRTADTAWTVIKDIDACYAEGVQAHLSRLAEHVPADRFGPGKPRLASSGAADRRSKMESSGSRLVEYVGGQICRGIVTGLNEAFMLDRETRDSLVFQDKKSAEVIKRLVVGDDVRRYEIHYRDSYILYLPHGCDIDRYPAIREHLRPFRKQLEGRATQQPWHELQQPQQAYVRHFEAAKIFYPEIGKELRFVLDESRAYPNAKAFFLPAADFFLLGVLNSATVFDFLKNVCSILGDENQGGRLEFRAQYMEQLPIPDASSADRERVGALAREAQRLHGERRARVERFLRDCDLSPAKSSSRNPLEMPWQLDAAEFTKRVRKPNITSTQPGLALYKAARDETAAQTEAIAKVEAELDARVASLYGLDGADSMRPNQGRQKQ